MLSKSLMQKERKSFRIFVSGNSLSKEDSIPIKLIPLLKKQFPKVDILELDPAETMPEEKHMVLIDTVINTKKIILINNLDQLGKQASYSLHDLDLATNLKLMKKLKILKKVTIIGLPPDIEVKKAFNELKAIITNLLSRNV